MPEAKGLVLSCNRDLNIEKILYNEIDIVIDDISNFFELFLESDRIKVKYFTENVKKGNAELNWELNLKGKDNIITLLFFGVCYNDKLIFAGAKDYSSIDSVFKNLMELNNEQVNYFRNITKKTIEQMNGMKEKNRQTFDEMSRLNNELSNLQRQVIKQNAELSELNKQKNRLLGIAAHDLRNPLGNILNFTEFIEEENDRLSDNQKLFLKEITMLSTFMLGMVDDLLDVSAIESGKVELWMVNTNLSEIIERCVTLNQMTAEKKQITIQAKIENPKIFLTVDKNKIFQVINNLLSNAIKYSNSNTTISTEIIEKETEILISVRDQGLGIAKDELAKLFNPFQRTTTQSTAGEKSTGLGLFIVRKIVEAHKGTIRAKSEVGVGSIFTIILPKNSSKNNT